MTARHLRFLATEVSADLLAGAFGRSSARAEDHLDALKGVASAAARSPAGSTLDATFVVRGGPVPALGVLGRFDARQAERVRIFIDGLPTALRQTRYVDYAAAEGACAVLADRLVTRLGRREINHSRFVAIPRGGHIVLGMLAMTLDLRAEQLEADPREGATPLVIVVDDCALSGHRFGLWLQSSPAGRVVFAPMFAAEGLAASIESIETERVVACVAGEELEDLGPQLHGDRYSGWQATWMARLDQPRYLVSEPENVAFAWKEPDASLWNAVSGQREPGWRIVPPALCLGNRSETGRPSRVQVQVPPIGPLCLADHVLYAQHDEAVVVSDMADGAVVALEGVAAAMWHALIATGSIEGITHDLSSRYEVSADQLREDAQGFVRTLQARSLLVDRDLE